LPSREDFVRMEGPLALHGGALPPWLRVLPYGALSFSFFDVAKGKLLRCHGAHTTRELPTEQLIVAGGVSIVSTQVVVHLLHNVQRHTQALALTKKGVSVRDADRSLSSGSRDVEQLSRRGGIPIDVSWRAVHTDASKHMGFNRRSQYTSMVAAFHKTWQTDGVANGLFKSTSMTWAQGACAVGVVWLIHTSLKARMARQQETDDSCASLPSKQGMASSSSRGGACTREMPRATAIESLICGGIAGATAKTVIAPAERVKILYQTDPARRFSLKGAWETGHLLVKKEGAQGLWRGHGATLLRVVPYSATTFATFDAYTVVVRDAAPGLGDVGVRFVSGAAAGATATALTYPLDVLRARMAVQVGKEAAPDGYCQALRRMVRTEGPGSLWSGGRITLLGIVPYSGLSFCIFETLKTHLQDGRGAGDALKTHERLFAGALSGLVAQANTSRHHPLQE